MQSRTVSNRHGTSQAGYAGQMPGFNCLDRLEVVLSPGTVTVCISDVSDELKNWSKRRWPTCKSVNVFDRIHKEWKLVDMLIYRLEPHTRDLLIRAT